MREELRDRALTLASGGERRILGIVGAPGAGKTTFTVALMASLKARGVAVSWLPMDGFHLADAQLARLGLSERKGAIETFDDAGYAALLQRVLAENERTVYAPGFERDIEQPIAAALAIDAGTRLVLTEGNYLLADTGSWPEARALMAETWYVDTPDLERCRRLIARHIAFGKTPEQAREWVDRVDEANARAVVAMRHTADLVVPGT